MNVHTFSNPFEASTRKYYNSHVFSTEIAVKNIHEGYTKNISPF
ncbi:hypothetical protein NHE_0726 [Neorickettsia helminthoeca str. Oregon]|uniref:Uncharacterized protein n=1 Tax=Neorickettsia helminthoeca str. Oregon TaxID=1286528 RepID=X5H4M7_9RICK|nr:hypothetical protein NHE_0726 [Neorickettsia helminthoeca str. Oregon]